MNPIVTSNPKIADAIEASGQVFEFAQQTPKIVAAQPVPCTDRCQLARPNETLSLKCVVDCRLGLA